MGLKDILYKYKPDGVSFVSRKATKIRTLYFPLAGITSESLKSSITPYLGGDIKIDKNHYLTKPVSREDLRYPLRNFFVYIDKKSIFSLTQEGSDSSIEIGQLWHILVKRFSAAGLELCALNLIPATGANVELMRIKIKNISNRTMKITPTAAIPIFGRTLANKHDHEHVTSLLHRIRQVQNGVLVRPTMVFDEKGHRKNNSVYYVLGISDDKENPAGTFPTIESFYGEDGTLFAPKAVMNNWVPRTIDKTGLQGKEAMGALRFEETVLKSGASKEYYIVMGIGESEDDALKTFHSFNSSQKFNQALEKNKSYWAEKSSSIIFTTGDTDFNAWTRWVGLQPVLRRLFGCSFLPDHDYGKGGKGWRDIWQDLLSLILIEPENVRDTLINNFAGVRIDGSNATVVGSSAGEFIADRNAITRVWMDHGVWPLLTTSLYINQTGAYNILLEKTAYFRDAQMSRTFLNDSSRTHRYGNRLKDKNKNIYMGTVLEHLLIQNLVQFFNVGDHNITRLESADWNDGLDMAFEKGESVAFMGLYGGNLMLLAELLDNFSKRKSINDIQLARETLILLDSIDKSSCNYNNADEKRKHLFQKYFTAVQPQISGEVISVNIKKVIADLHKKGHWIFDHIRKNEKVTVNDRGKDHVWFNGYYDNKGRRVEGKHDKGIRMTLTGQVFPIMSGLAHEKEICAIVESIQAYLKDKNLGGFRLNTDFGIPHYLDLGRAFGFAYGTKENGAFFSHMAVMYAYALYSRGFVKEGHEVLQSLYKMSTDTVKSKIYPGIPEYFDSEGLGMYHYLTGSASWFVLTELTQVFGIRGSCGNLILSPKLLKGEFSKDGNARVECKFAGKNLKVCYSNPDRLSFGDYEIKEVILNDGQVQFKRILPSEVMIERSIIEKAPLECKIHVLLSAVAT